MGEVDPTSSPVELPHRGRHPMFVLLSQLAPWGPRGWLPTLAVDRRALLSPLDPHSNMGPAAFPGPEARKAGRPASQRRPDCAAQATMSHDLCP